MVYRIVKVDGVKRADDIQRFNNRFKDTFVPLKDKHFTKGFWWLVYRGDDIVGFAGTVPFDPFPRVGYLKRGAILAEHRGHGLQHKLIKTRERHAIEYTDWTHIVSDCHKDSIVSANNFIRAGYKLVEAERWEKGYLVWRKELPSR